MMPHDVESPRIRSPGFVQPRAVFLVSCSQGTPPPLTLWLEILILLRVYHPEPRVVSFMCPTFASPRIARPRPPKCPKNHVY